MDGIRWDGRAGGRGGIEHHLLSVFNMMTITTIYTNKIYISIRVFTFTLNVVVCRQTTSINKAKNLFCL